MSFTLIETKTLGTAAASIEFTSIPQDGTDLLALISTRHNGLNNANYAVVSFNSSTSNFSSRYLQGDGSSRNSGTLARFFGNITGATSTSNTFGSIYFYVPNYAGSTQKSYSVDSVTENNATNAVQDIIAGLWADTSAITSVTFTMSADNFVSGSTISLYKITKGSDGIVTVS